MIKKLLLFLLLAGVFSVYSYSQEKVVADTAKETSDSLWDKVFTPVDSMASFRGGNAAWIKFLQKNLRTRVPVNRNAPSGKYTVMVIFKVDKQGKIYDIKTENNPGYGTAEEAVRVLMKSPKWIPGMQNGKNVICVMRQPITFVVVD